MIVRPASWAIIILAGFCYAAMVCGHVFSPADARVADFALCDDRPCLMGIIPGQTDWVQAAALLKNRGASIADKQITLLLEPDSSAVFYMSVNQTTVGRIYINGKRPIDAGWMIQRFGKPCGISLYTAAGLLTIRYSNLLANVQLTGQKFRPDASVVSIEFSDPNFRLKMQPDLCVDNVTSRETVNATWHGFAPLRIYQQVGS